MVTDLVDDDGVKEATISVLDAGCSDPVTASVGSGEGSPMNERTPYFIASASKLYATAIIMQLREEGKLRLDDHVTDLLPDVPLAGLHVWKGRDRTTEITVRQLLSHTSGLGDYFDDAPSGQPSVADAVLMGKDSRWDLEEVVGYVRLELPPHFPPGEPGEARYSDTNFQLLGGIIEAVTGESLESNVERRIVDRLGLVDTYLYSEQEEARRGEVLPLRNGDRILDVPQAMSSVRLDGGVVSTSADSLHFLKSFIQGDLFPRDYLSEMEAWLPIFIPLEAGTGLLKFQMPWYFAPFQHRPGLIGHSGISGAFAFYDPEADRFIVGTTNQIDPQSALYKLAFRAATL